MAIQNTQTISRKPGMTDLEDSLAVADSTDKRLAILLKVNEETARRKRLYAHDRERLEADLMSRPLRAEEALSYFGLMLGIFPPATIFTRFVIDSGLLFSDGAWFIGVLLIVNVVSAVVGFVSGKWIGRIVSSLEKHSWSEMILLLPFVGILWGFMAGGASGFVIVMFGAIFGAVIGGLVGAAALPMFAVLHRILKRGELIEAKQFLPLAMGITLSVCSFILGR